jgi:phage terminase small subunit
VWVEGVAKTYALEEHHLKLLVLAGEAFDRAAEAREAISKHGTTYVDRFNQPRARPEVAIARDASIAFARLLRELALDVAAPDPRPPGLSG